MRFFQGIHWLLTWIVIYIALYVFIVAKHTDTYGIWNLGAMAVAFITTVTAMWVRSLL